MNALAARARPGAARRSRRSSTTCCTGSSTSSTSPSRAATRSTRRLTTRSPGACSRRARLADGAGEGVAVRRQRDVPAALLDARHVRPRGAAASGRRGAGVDAVDFCYAWVAARPGVDSILVGPATVAQLDDAIEAVAHPASRGPRRHRRARARVDGQRHELRALGARRALPFGQAVRTGSVVMGLVGPSAPSSPSGRRPPPDRLRRIVLRTTKRPGGPRGAGGSPVRKPGRGPVAA